MASRLQSASFPTATTSSGAMAAPAHVARPGPASGPDLGAVRWCCGWGRVVCVRRGPTHDSARIRTSVSLRYRCVPGCLVPSFSAKGSGYVLLAARSAWQTPPSNDVLYELECLTDEDGVFVRVLVVCVLESTNPPLDPLGVVQSRGVCFSGCQSASDQPYSSNSSGTCPQGASTLMNRVVVESFQ